MKPILFLILLLLFSCEKKIKSSSPEKKPETAVADSSTITENDITAAHPWFSYFKEENPNFDADAFKLTQNSPINYQKSTITILNQKGFNEIYKPFFVFNESGTQYLDFDSYQWELLPDGSAGFEADQQVALVDYQNKKVRQIAFFGPSYWIEDAYWKGDSVAVLLGNSYEKVPFIMKYNFNKNEVKHFEYSDTLKIEIPYSEVRLRSKGIKVQ